MPVPTLSTPRRRRVLRGLAPAAALTALTLGVSACGSATGGGAQADAKAPDGAATKVTITLTEEGCKPEPSSVAAGPITFTVQNQDATSISEAELRKDKHPLGEKENLTPGLSGDFSLRLDGGKYEVYCPGGTQSSFPFTVTGNAKTATQSPVLDTATAGYRSYVIAQTDTLQKRTTAFVAAVKAGNRAQAKKLYAPTRVYYERIEPVAESFGDLDPAIDARVNDVEDTAQWTGFHRLEKALWQDKSLAGTGPIADTLLTDVNKLHSLVTAPGATYQPAELANGAVSLLDEIAKSKLPGEEDRYSHTDLYDFQANVDGSKKAFELLEPALKQTDPNLASQVSSRFAAVDSALDPYRAGSGFITYTTKTVSPAKRRVLANAINALAESLSQVAAKVVKAG